MQNAISRLSKFLSLISIAIQPTSSLASVSARDPEAHEGIAHFRKNYPFVASILRCSAVLNKGKSYQRCEHYCTGNLIAPDIVLTAGHCVSRSRSSTQDHASAENLSGIRVVIGTSVIGTDIDESPHLLKVIDSSNAGYNQNVRFPTDDDVGLFFLELCLSPSLWHMGIVSTPEHPLDDPCSEVQVVSWHQQHHSKKSSLTSYENRIQPYEVCRDWYVSKNFLDPEDSYSFTDLWSAISFNRHLCHAGDSKHSTCYGDSGAPILAHDVLNDRMVIVGLTSFGPTSFCGGGPAYVARISTYAAWIDFTAKRKSNCIYNNALMFVTYPVSERSSFSREGRCGTGEWQCEVSGNCIKSELVCNGEVECDDASDENAYFCNRTGFAASNIPEPSICESILNEYGNSECVTEINAVRIYVGENVGDGDVLARSCKALEVCLDQLGWVDECEALPLPSELTTCMQLDYLADLETARAQDAAVFSAQYGHVCG